MSEELIKKVKLKIYNVTPIKSEFEFDIEFYFDFKEYDTLDENQKEKETYKIYEAIKRGVKAYNRKYKQEFKEYPFYSDILDGALKAECYETIPLLKDLKRYHIEKLDSE
jgi:hypothetical protein